MTAVIEFPECLAAHQKGRDARYGLCRALAKEIPASAYGAHNGAKERLQDCAKELERETGESPSWITLREYREVGIWLGDNEPVSTESYTSHRRGAMSSGKSFEDWSADPSSTPYVDYGVSTIVDNASHGSRVDLVRDLLTSHPEAIREAIAEAGSTAVAYVVQDRNVADDLDRAYAVQRDPEASAARLGSGVSNAPRIERPSFGGGASLNAPANAATDSDIRGARLAGTARQNMQDLKDHLESHSLSENAVQKITLDLMEAREALDAIATLLASGVIAG